MLTSKRMAAAALCLLGAGCMTATRRASGSGTDHQGGFAASVVTAGELARLHRTASLREALELVRPTMLFVQGVSPMVSVDGGPLMEISYLRSIPTSGVREVRLVRTSPAGGHTTVRNREPVPGAVIVVSNWTPR